MLTREDANTETVLLAEWLVEDREQVRRGQPVCVVETSKASLELEAPGAGSIVQLYPAGAEVEPGRTIALVAETEAEVAQALAEARERERPRPSPPAGARKATKKAIALAERYGIDLDSIDKAGFVTAEDVEALAAALPRGGGESSLLAGISTEGLTLPTVLGLPDAAGRVDPTFLAGVRGDPEAVRALPSDEKCARYRAAGADIGDGVVLGDGVLLDSPRIVIGPETRIGAGSTVRCEELLAIGTLTHVGPGLELACRRAYLGDGIHAGRAIRIGGGGHRDPWALLVVGDTAFLGDEIFVNPCRPVLIGAEAFVTMRSVIVTHNIGHSVLEGFENRFAPVVIEDRAQVGIGTVVYAGCRIGHEAIVASSSYVVSDIPPGRLAIGVPARVAGAAKRPLARTRQAALALGLVEELRELLALRGHAVRPAEADGAAGFSVETSEGGALVLFAERLRDVARLPRADAGTIVLTLEADATEPPDGVAVIDLIARRLNGTGGVALDSVREFCRKRGIRIAPGPWRYPGGLV